METVKSHLTIQETSIFGVRLFKLTPIEDARGWFARLYYDREFDEFEIYDIFSQVNLSFTERCGTIRGLHYQADPYAQAKIVQCLHGAIYDVILDLRKESSTYKTWFSVELSDKNRQSVYIPEGCAHGFQTLTDHCDVLYLATNDYAPAANRGVRWDDPSFNFSWPKGITLVSNQDQNWANWID